MIRISSGITVFIFFCMNLGIKNGQWYGPELSLNHNRKTSAIFFLASCFLYSDFNVFQDNKNPQITD